MQLTDHDLDVVARTLYGECRGERLDGQIAVAWVIRNRATWDALHDGHPEHEWWGVSPADVCQHKYQFSCWLPSDPNSERLHDPKLSEDRVYRFLLQLAADVFADKHPDPTNGATHYKVWNTRASWDATCAGHEGVRIGAHLFFNLGPHA
jgi:N-acetylmuramoyl-L-alanine amidase